MLKLRVILYVILFNILYLSAYGLSNPVTFDIKPHTVKKQSRYMLGIDIKVAEGWKLYGNLEADLGIPFEQKIIEGSNIQTYRFDYPVTSLKYESIDGESFSANYFKNYSTIKLKIVPSDKTQPITGKIITTYGICNEACYVEERVDEINLPAIMIMDDASELGAPLMKTLYVLLLAILGGMILNFMPCVLPVVSLKIFSLINQSNKAISDIRWSLFSTIVGIISTFALFGIIVIVLKSLGNIVGWGYHFQEPGFVIFLLFLLLLIILNLWGLFEINIGRFANILLVRNLEDKKIIASFAQGVIITLLATPCTAPFLGTAVAYSLSQESMSLIMLTYIAIGIGMSIPLIGLFSYPTMLQYLPHVRKSMPLIKKIIALILGFTIVWLLYVLLQQTNAYLTIILLCSFAVIILAVIAMKFSANHKRLLWSMIITALVTPLVLENLNEIAYDIKAAKSDSIWQEFSEGRLLQAIASGEKVLVDVTADWCINCKYNKKFVFEAQEIQKHLLNNRILLLRADITKNNEYTKSVKRYMASVGAGGIPLNIYYNGSDDSFVILPTILRQNDITALQ